MNNNNNKKLSRIYLRLRANKVLNMDSTVSSRTGAHHPFSHKKLYDLKTKQEALKSESDHQYSYI